MNNKHHHNYSHTPVLLNEVLRALVPKQGESYLDLTAGYGGHASAVIAHTKQPERALLVDRDSMAINRLGGLKDQGAVLWHSDFAGAAKQLVEQHRSFDMILLDLGVSSPHIDIPERGFSFQADGPLDMRMDQTQALTAEEVVNSYTHEQLTYILRVYGEEPRAKHIAQAIIDARPLKTTHDLSEAVMHIYRRKVGKTHPATRTFQAIRLAVNQELEQLEATLLQIEQLLAPSGRVAIISFHSLEDRIVKQFFASRAKVGYESTLTLINAKPIMASNEELVLNPRARSAKLRAAQLK